VQEINGPGEWPVLFFGDTFIGILLLPSRQPQQTARQQRRGGNRFANP
jgi:hypothetical protein